MEERRRGIRRQADRERIARMQELESGLLAGQQRSVDSEREQRHLRRRAIRHECKVRIVLDVAHSTGNLDTWAQSRYHVKGRMLDLSVEGASVFTRDALTIGQAVGLEIAIQQGGAFQVRGHVRWCKSVDQRDGYASGIQFARIEPRDRQRIGAFLHHLDETIGL